MSLFLCYPNTSKKYQISLEPLKAQIPGSLWCGPAIPVLVLPLLMGVRSGLVQFRHPRNCTEPGARLRLGMGWGQDWSQDIGWKPITCCRFQYISLQIHLGFLRLFKFHLTLQLFPIVGVVGQRDGEGGRVVLLGPEQFAPYFLEHQQFELFATIYVQLLGRPWSCLWWMWWWRGWWVDNLCGLSAAAAARQQNSCHCSSSYGGITIISACLSFRIDPDL